MIAKAKIYPPKPREKGQQGKIYLSFKIAKDGNVLKLLVEHSSGYEILDEAARIAITEAGPFPPFPETIKYTICIFGTSYFICFEMNHSQKIDYPC
ncbi:MAG: hypothetical protein CM1200mP16_14620 [Nitrospina sp.]|nr:MAG: hypothetical protein CM1200mP16_14620 [Nitrospina sp.]